MSKTPAAVPQRSPKILLALLSLQAWLFIVGASAAAQTTPPGRSHGFTQVFLARGHA